MESHFKTPVALAVDDEPQVLRLIARCLRSEGFHVLLAHSRAEDDPAPDLLDLESEVRIHDRF